MSGSVSLAEAGTLTLMVGGEVADLERARPALESLAKTIFHLGPLGAGAGMKLAVNAVIFGLNGALAEGLVLAEAAGVDRALAYDVIAAGAAGAPSSATNGPSSSTPRRRPWRSRSPSPRRTCGSSPRRRGARPAAAADRRQPRADPGCLDRRSGWPGLRCRRRRAPVPARPGHRGLTRGGQSRIERGPQASSTPAIAIGGATMAEPDPHQARDRPQPSIWIRQNLLAGL